jgi:hypothetical protein
LDPDVTLLLDSRPHMARREWESRTTVQVRDILALSISSYEVNLPSISSDSILKDLTADMDKPMWPLSSYGPARNEPVLIPNLDESPEELRVKAFTAIQSGTPDAYVRLIVLSMPSNFKLIMSSSLPAQIRVRENICCGANVCERAE